jgi:predicted transcriptional regulator
MSDENIVFRKIKEISARGIHPRPAMTAIQISSELSMSADRLLPTLAQLKQLGLVNFCDTKGSAVKLTLLGTVVKREK